SDHHCNTPLLKKAQVSASSSAKGRDPSEVRLEGVKSWTANSNDAYQHLIIDLGEAVSITSIVTKGNKNYDEYVTEYTISYGTNGFDYTDYKTEEGYIKIFDGNTDGNSEKSNVFEVPIVAQWIKINPIRWFRQISMRIELYGCHYASDVISFNGNSIVRINLFQEPIETEEHSLSFRFKTNNADGILVYSRGTQGDILAIQLHDNKLLLNIDLGSGVMTSASIGSLLDDNIWHDVLISRNKHNLTLSVDRVVVRKIIEGPFKKLNLNQALYFGGVPNMQKGQVVFQNFTGCMENFYLNKTNFFRQLREAESVGEAGEYMVRMNANFGCSESSVVPVTFLTTGSFVRLQGWEGSQKLHISLSFRTFRSAGLLVLHSFRSSGNFKLFLEKGKLIMQIYTKESPEAILDNFEQRFNDGKWHKVLLEIKKNSITLEIDEVTTKISKRIDIQTGEHYYIGGGLLGSPRFVGFVGCMKQISIDGSYRLPANWKKNDMCCDNEILYDACQILDRCTPNPCKHNGICTQPADEFECNCTKTGYTGAVCRTSNYPLSCEAYKSVHSVSQQENIYIDIDGSGPLDPFPVTCEFHADDRVSTILRHDHENPTLVDGYSNPGSYIRTIQYDANLNQIEALLNRSSSCRQRLSYACHNSRLFDISDPQSDVFDPNSWWVSRGNEKMNYWGGGLPGSQKCECGVSGTCIDKKKMCNCDAGYSDWYEDGGDILEKEYLPVRQLRFGDTGNVVDDKQGRYTLGPLICEGDDVLNNVVTFRILDATIDLPTFDMGHNGDIYFEFKTTIENAVIIHSTGPTNDFIKVSIVAGNQIQFEYKSGEIVQTVSVQTSDRLNNNNWHSVTVERNQKEAQVIIDGAIKNSVRETPGPIRPLHLTSNLVIGATTQFTDGFIGCIRSLLLNGELQDLRQYARRGTYGIGEGCVGKCVSNPCLNNGTCIEKYNAYDCDCRWTAFKGPICADEIGVNMRPDSMIRYDFTGNWRSTISEYIRVGFSTTDAKGFLLGLSSNISGEYLTVMVSNSGHLKVVFDFGFERQELIYPTKLFNLAQYHDLIIKRENEGATMLLIVDGNEPKKYHFNIKTSSDAQFNNIQYLYIGKNESMTDGYFGCISRVQFDDFYPLKLLFQQEGPANIKSTGGPITEDFCGVEPITHPPNVVETRPPLHIDQAKLKAAFHEWNKIILGSVLSILFIALVAMTALILKYISLHKGEYLTHEEKGSENVDDPDSAVVNSIRGHQVERKQEWFM
ncbi:neurexin-4-like, partial [Chelonus insularis]|uniref:neurexin-4-like n=1 Tax=Chelonus insularis TaxID=460826 RepID=UPI001589EFCA